MVVALVAYVGRDKIFNGAVIRSANSLKMNTCDDLANLFMLIYHAPCWRH